jgi:hypothetical protein
MTFDLRIYIGFLISTILDWTFVFHVSESVRKMSGFICVELGFNFSPKLEYDNNKLFN